jgi:hypothetical protein
MRTLQFVIDLPIIFLLIYKVDRSHLLDAILIEQQEKETLMKSENTAIFLPVFPHSGVCYMRAKLIYITSKKTKTDDLLKLYYILYINLFLYIISSTKILNYIYLRCHKVFANSFFLGIWLLLTQLVD